MLPDTVSICAPTWAHHPESMFPQNWSPTKYKTGSYFRENTVYILTLYISLYKMLLNNVTILLSKYCNNNLDNWVSFKLSVWGKTIYPADMRYISIFLQNVFSET